MLTGVADRLSCLREERPSAGTRYRLMGMVADIAEVVETLSKEVLERVKQEAVLDADVDVDYDVMADEVLSWKLEMTSGDLQEQTQQVNDVLPPPKLYPRKHRELLRALVAVRSGIGTRKVHLSDLDSAYSMAFPMSTPLNVNKKKRSA